MRLRGFTLIELLVVIAIIAILAAILFPVFARAREKARSAACQSNCKQIALAIEQYKQDYDASFPIWYAGTVATRDPISGANTTLNISWGDIIQPYLKNYQMLKCPSDPVRATSWSNASSFQVNRNVIFDENLACIPHPSVWGSRCCRGNKPAMSDAKIAHPGATIAIAEYSGSPPSRTHNEPESTRLCWDSWRTCNAGRPRPTLDEIIQRCRNCGDIRHFDGAVHIFYDGHAKWLGYDKTFGCWDNFPSARCGIPPDGTRPHFGVEPLYPRQCP